MWLGPVWAEHKCEHAQREDSRDHQQAVAEELEEGYPAGDGWPATQFDGATGNLTGTVSAVALLARNPDGSCSFTGFPRLEVDKFAEGGTLSF